MEIKELQLRPPIWKSICKSAAALALIISILGFVVALSSNYGSSGAKQDAMQKAIDAIEIKKVDRTEFNLLYQLMKDVQKDVGDVGDKVDTANLRIWMHINSTKNSRWTTK
jgi:hypothetical protein